ncbi:MAG: aminoacyl-tRNA hydrolase [Treponemataceae bacterium]|nr:aminoacyl-tRNA hydrolase [Treponemataceae bacterium]
MIKLIAFLGNYGKQYSGNRHNTAWLFAESLSIYPSLNWQSKFKGQYAAENNQGSYIYYLKPETYMNLSGDSIIELAHFYKIKPEEILVVHDELELPLGAMSLKWSGGLGGHNGLRSTKANLGTADFWRLRFGIGRPEHPDIAGYVLSDFSKAEREVLDKIFIKGQELLDKLKNTSPDKLLDEYKKVLA